MFDKVLDIGVKVYQMSVEELQTRKAELKKTYEEHSNHEVQIELLVINTRLVDEGILDIDKLDNDEKGLMEMYIGLK
jgi:hypothetical protein